MVDDDHPQGEGASSRRGAGGGRANSGDSDRENRSIETFIC